MHGTEEMFYSAKYVELIKSSKCEMSRTYYENVALLQKNSANFPACNLSQSVNGHIQ